MDIKLYAVVSISVKLKQQLVSKIGEFKIPVFSYQVSGEYSLIKEGIKKGIIDDEAIFESLISLKRAGSTCIVSYFADKIDKIIPNY